MLTRPRPFIRRSSGAPQSGVRRMRLMFRKLVLSLAVAAGLIAQLVSSRFGGAWRRRLRAAGRAGRELASRKRSVRLGRQELLLVQFRLARSGLVLVRLCLAARDRLGRRRRLARLEPPQRPRQSERPRQPERPREPERPRQRSTFTGRRPIAPATARPGQAAATARPEAVIAPAAAAITRRRRIGAAAGHRGGGGGHRR